MRSTRWMKQEMQKNMEQRSASRGNPSSSGYYESTHNRITPEDTRVLRSEKRTSRSRSGSQARSIKESLFGRNQSRTSVDLDRTISRDSIDVKAERRSHARQCPVRVCICQCCAVEVSETLEGRLASVLSMIPPSLVRLGRCCVLKLCELRCNINALVKLDF